MSKQRDKTSAGSHARLIARLSRNRDRSNDWGDPQGKLSCSSGCRLVFPVSRMRECVCLLCFCAMRVYIYIYISVFSDVNVYADDAHDRCIYNKCIQSTNLITSNLSFHAAMGRQSVETDFGSDDVQIQ